MRVRTFCATVATVVLAAPAVVLATSTDHVATVSQQEYVSTGAQATNSTSWQNVPGLTLPGGSGQGMITVSANLTQGKARFRVWAQSVTSGPSYVDEPGPVEFSAPGSQSFTFYNSQDCHLVRVQWQRVGSGKASLSKASVGRISASPSYGCG